MRELGGGANCRLNIQGLLHLNNSEIYWKGKMLVGDFLNMDIKSVTGFICLGNKREKGLKKQEHLIEMTHSQCSYYTSCYYGKDPDVCRTKWVLMVVIENGS